MLKYGKGICYSGYRAFQSPSGDYPTEMQVKEDLDILVNEGFNYIRMYGPVPHARVTLEVIRKYKLPLKVFLGFEPRTEVFNPNCPWDKRERTKEELLVNRAINDTTLDLLIRYSKIFDDEIIMLSVGNENTAEWTSNVITEDRLVEFVKKLKSKTDKLVTFNEGAIEWKKLAKLASVVDVISIHSYPLWHGISWQHAYEYTIKEYLDILSLYPDKQIIYGEAGWTTSCDHQMNKEIVNEENQKEYLDHTLAWADENRVVFMIFEAFDEPWKGGNNPIEPEKHWGIFNVDRTPKLVMKK